MRAGILMIGLALMFLVATGQANEYRVYPASYELVWIDEGEERPVAAGSVRLKPGEGLRVTGERPRTAVTESRASAVIRFTLERTPESSTDGARLVVVSDVDVSTAEGLRRVEAEDDSESFIQGPTTSSASFHNRSWRHIGDPTPIVAEFEEGGNAYRLTLIFEPAALL